MEGLYPILGSYSSFRHSVRATSREAELTTSVQLSGPHPEVGAITLSPAHAQLEGHSDKATQVPDNTRRDQLRTLTACLPPQLAPWALCSSLSKEPLLHRFTSKPALALLPLFSCRSLWPRTPTYHMWSSSTDHFSATSHMSSHTVTSPALPLLCVEEPRQSRSAPRTRTTRSRCALTLGTAGVSTPLGTAPAGQR